MAKSRYPVPAGEVRVEDVIQRSRFIATLAPVDSIDAAREFIARISAEFPDATHNCSAFLIGEPGSTAHIGLSDDGEPHGTAGRPMLNVLLTCGLGDLAVVVTRYFGGIKLGKGGLVRAYAGAVKLAVNAAERTERISWQRLAVTLDYCHVETIKRLYPEFEVQLDNEEFADVVRHELRVPEEQAEALQSALTDRTHGTVKIEALDAAERTD
ncbi:YigZ family protein [bacterium]|nr:YigZ family protein [bacterium]